jgi:hypothetical protein
MKCRKCNQSMVEFGTMQVQGFDFDVVVFVCKNQDCEFYGILVVFNI